VTSPLGAAFGKRKPANDSDPFEADFQKKAGTEKVNPYADPFGDMPGPGGPSKDSDNNNEGNSPWKRK
jgi:hypothetical protein